MYLHTVFGTSYRQELKVLNESVLRWIEQHVRSDPTCILSPVFADYNRYVEELDKKYPVDVDSSKPSSRSTDGGSKSSDACSLNGQFFICKDFESLCCFYEEFY